MRNALGDGWSRFDYTAGIIEVGVFAKTGSQAYIDLHWLLSREVKILEALRRRTKPAPHRGKGLYAYLDYYDLSWMRIQTVCEETVGRLCTYVEGPEHGRQLAYGETSAAREVLCEKCSLFLGEEYERQLSEVESKVPHLDRHN